MFYLLVMATLVSFIACIYLIASGSLVAGIALGVLCVLLVVIILTNYSSRKVQDCLDVGGACGDALDCIK
ncbi:hypothetical protein ACQCN2_12040 [Brevibacillus ginsengisoli]|uniref:hypothetical protein n=1 Tax=Brevibacillus ginsengisoli TaxID=363854 RepID=UPI003CE8E5AF